MHCLDKYEIGDHFFLLENWTKVFDYYYVKKSFTSSIIKVYLGPKLLTDLQGLKRAVRKKSTSGLSMLHKQFNSYTIGIGT